VARPEALGRAWGRFTEAIGFPAFIPRGHEFEQYSDCAFHRDCYLKWDDHDRFQQLYDDYDRVWKSRPKDLTFDEIETWGKAAFERVFSQGMTKTS
jgi:hypothetical protein